MAKKLVGYPRITEFMSDLPNPDDTFLSDRVANHKYGFWPHFEYFLSNLERLKNYEPIVRRLSVTAPLSMPIDKAWGKWQIFRSAQSEITVIFLIEKFLRGRVLEIIPEDSNLTPDLRINLGRLELHVEVKAQSGQQHGDRHPRENGWVSFDPKDETDLRSWLFEERIGSRSSKPMKPKALEAEDKGADILVAMTDIFSTHDEIKSQAPFICAKSEFIGARSIEIGRGKSLIVHFFESVFPLARKAKRLKEIWLFDESHLDRFAVLSEAMFLFNHLKTSSQRGSVERVGLALILGFAAALVSVFALGPGQKLASLAIGSVVAALAYFFLGKKLFR